MKNANALIESLKEERKQLLQKIDRLGDFITSEDFDELDEESRILLWEQWANMRRYEQTLCKRIAHAICLKKSWGE